MKLLVINPPRVDNCPVVREERYEHKDMGAVYPPLNLLHVCTQLMQGGHHVRLIDANGRDIALQAVQELVRGESYDLIISRVGFDTQHEDMEFLSALKDTLGCRLVVRNKIIADVQELRDAFVRLHTAVDIFVNDEYEYCLARIVEALAAGNAPETIPNITFRRQEQLYTTRMEPPQHYRIPAPAYSLLGDLSPYHTGVLSSPMALVTTSTGCPFRCSFCAYAGTTYVTREPDEVVEELALLKREHRIKSFLFFDDLIGLDKGRFEAICRGIIDRKLGLAWATCTRANLLNGPLLTLMKKAGCREIAIGIESGDEEILKRTGKGITLDDIRHAAKLMHKAKILFYGLAIIGLPGESRESVRRTIRFIKEINPFYTQLCFATPFPNTAIYRYFKENGYLESEDFSRYSPLAAVPVIRTELLSREELVALRAYAYRKLLFRPLYLLSKIRPFDMRWNISGFLHISQRIIALVRGDNIR